MSALLRETQALINSVIGKTKDLETDIRQLQKESNMAGLLPPYVRVEFQSDRNPTSVVISRKVLMTCQTMVEFYGVLTKILHLSGPKILYIQEVGNGGTRKPLGHVRMKVLAIFDPANKFPTNQDWCQIAEWDESLFDILAVVSRLKVIALDHQAQDQ